MHSVEKYVVLCATDVIFSKYFSIGQLTVRHPCFADIIMLGWCNREGKKGFRCLFVLSSNPQFSRFFLPHLLGSMLSCAPSVPLSCFGVMKPAVFALNASKIVFSCHHMHIHMLTVIVWSHVLRYVILASPLTPVWCFLVKSSKIITCFQYSC